MSLACVGSTHSVLATLGLLRSRRVFFPRLHCSGSRLLSREQVLSCVRFPGLSRSGSGSRVVHKDAGSVGPAFCAFPGPSSSGSQERDSTLSPGAARLIPSRVPACFRARGWTLCLFWEADFWLRPSRWMSTIQNLKKSLVRNWKPVCSLVRGALSGAEFARFRLWLAPAFPLLPAGDGPVCSRLTLLWYCSVLCSVSGLAAP